MDTLVKVKIDELTVGEFNSQYKTYQTAIVVNGSRRTGFINEKGTALLKESNESGTQVELVFYTNGTYENFKMPTKIDRVSIELDRVKAFLKTKFPEDFPTQALQEPTETITDSPNAKPTVSNKPEPTDEPKQMDDLPW